MNSATVFLYILHAIPGVVGMIVAYLILKYLNRKPLGMQTTFDQMIKDLIYLSMLQWTVYTLILTSIEGVTHMNDNIALTLTFFHIMLKLARIWQFSMILMIRFFSVFYQNIMNSVDECFVRRLTRSFVGIISIISALFINLEYMVVYQEMTKESMSRHGPPMMLLISAIVCVIVLIVTQYKIEMFKKSVDVRAKFDQLEENESNQESKRTNMSTNDTNAISIWGFMDEDENNQESNRTNYNKNTVRILLSISSVTLLFIILILGALSRPEYIHLLIASSILNFINNVIIPVIYIVRNENLYHFCQCQIKKIFKCC